MIFPTFFWHFFRRFSDVCLSDVCPFWRLSFLTFVASDVCPFWRLSLLTFVLSDVCRSDVCRSDVCPFRRLSVYRNFEWKTWTVDHHMWYNIGRRLLSDPFCQQLTNGQFHRNQSCISSFWLKNCPWIMSARLVSEHRPGGGNVRSSFDAIISTNKEMNFKFFNSRKKQHLQQLLIKN